MHKTFISYHHKNEQDLKDDILLDAINGDYFIDKSVSDGDIDTDLSEDTIMRKIREEYLQTSTVIIVLIGEETSQRPYVNSEVQAALWGEKPTGLVGVVRDDLYDRLYTTTTCNSLNCYCGISLNSPTFEFTLKVPFLVKENHYRLENEEDSSPHFNNSQSYCSIYKYSDFKKNMEKIIDESYEKRFKHFDIKKRNESGVKTIRNPHGL